MTELPEDDCPHCSPQHGTPDRCSWSVRVGNERDSDNQPVALIVQPTNGAHVASADADWLWELIRQSKYAPRFYINKNARDINQEE